MRDDPEKWGPIVRAKPPETRLPRVIPGPPPPNWPRDLATARVVVAHRDFGRGGGLTWNAEHTAAVLTRLGIPAVRLPIPGGKLPDPQAMVEPLAAAPHCAVVVLQTPWFPPEQLLPVVDARPDIHWIARCHSNLAFLAVEPDVMQTLRALQAARRPNLHIAGVSAEFAQFMRDAYGLPCLYVPNLYDLPATLPDRVPDDGKRPLVLGCFGAPRLQKNVPTAIGAAVLVSRLLGREVEIRVNDPTTTPGGSNATALLEHLTAGTNARLAMQPWLPSDEFRVKCREVDLGLQLSSTETFNLVSADLAAAGVSSVVSEVIGWLPAEFHAPLDDPNAAAAVAVRLLADPDSGRRARAALDTHCQGAAGAWLSLLAGWGVRPRPTLHDLGPYYAAWSGNPGWALSRATARRLADDLRTYRPRRILECGSGLSTGLLAASGAAVVSLEHDPACQRATLDYLDRLGLSADVRLASLTGDPPTYDVAGITGPFDALFVDGPPGGIGRGPVLSAVRHLLRAGALVWLDDADRDRSVWDAWQAAGWLQAARVLPTDRGLGVARLRDVPAPPCPHAIPGPVEGKCPRWFLCGLRKTAVTAKVCEMCESAPE